MGPLILDLAGTLHLSKILFHFPPPIYYLLSGFDPLLTYPNTQNNSKKKKKSGVGIHCHASSKYGVGTVLCSFTAKV